jgi:hypothetical protein
MKRKCMRQFVKPWVNSWLLQLGHIEKYGLSFELLQYQRICRKLYALMFELPTGPYTKSVVDALDKLFILHADHEQNCSTSTVRMVGSSHAGLFASISAGVSALWGPLHGGAEPSSTGNVRRDS